MIICTTFNEEACTTSSGVSRVSFRRGVKIFLEKWRYLHGASRHAARGKATRLLGGSGACSPEKI